MKKLLILLIVSVVALICRAEKITVTIDIEHADRAVMKTQGGSGRTISLEDGSNTIVFDTETDGPSLTVQDVEENGYIQYLYVNNLIGNSINPVDGVFTIPLNNSVSTITIITQPAQAESELWFDANKPGQVEVTVNGNIINLEESNACSAPKKSLVTIKALAGFKLLEVSTQAARVDITETDGVYSFYATANNINITVRSQIDSDDNVCINIDHADYASVTTKGGEVLQLHDGDNYFKLDYNECSPLLVVPEPSCEVEYIFLNEEMFNPYQTSYTLDLLENGFTEITIATSKEETAFTLYADNAQAISVFTDQGRKLELQDGANSLEIDWDMDNPLTIMPQNGANILSVSNDNYMEIPSSDGVFRDIYVWPGSQLIVTTDMPADEKWITIVDEDFSRLSAGSEESPTMDPPLLNEMGYVNDNSMFNAYNSSCTLTWGGQNWAQAGGALAVMGGFVNTPTGDYSGPLKMTFRAKLVPGQGLDSHELTVTLMRRSALVDYKRTSITLTNEWQDFEIEADNGFFRDCMFQFVDIQDMENFSFLIDDVKIKHRIVSIESPVAIEPYDMTDNSFVASWKTTPTAEEYLLSVYEHVPSSEKIECNEGFECINAENGIIDSSNPNYPEGWEFQLANNGVSVGIDDSGQAVKLEKNGDYIIVPKSPYGMSEASFYARIDKVEGNCKGASLQVKALEDNDWYSWMSIPLDSEGIYGGATARANLTDYLYLFENVYQFRVELVAPSDADIVVSIDDVKYVAPYPPDKDYLWEDYVIDGNEKNNCVVGGEGFDPDAEYFYQVKARNSQFTSMPSNEVEVFNVHTPKALEATNVTETSYTANWACGSKADYFAITQTISLTAQQDMDNVTILEEDFSNVKSQGTPENPETGQYTAAMVSIDQYTTLSGWTASSYAIADGMIGTLPTQPGYMPGSICTPAIDLSHNGGVCEVAIRVYGSQGSYIIVAGDHDNSFAYRFDKTGWMDVKGTLHFCSDKETVTVYSSDDSGYPVFFLDRIVITQSLKAGDKTTIRTKSVRVDDRDARSFNVSDVTFLNGYELGYAVTAYRYYHGDKKDIYASAMSETVIVPTPQSSIKDVEDINGIRVLGVSGGMNVILPVASNVKVYTVDGVCVNDFAAPAGSTFVSLPSAFYVVCVGKERVKVAVR